MKRRLLSVARATSILLALGATMLASPSFSVILSDGEGIGNANLSVVTATRHVGALNGASGTHIGNGWILTANHVGPGDITLDGTAYQLLPGTELRLETSPGVYADLLMFRVYPAPELPSLAIRTEPPTVGDPVLMVGNGRDRGAPITFDPYGPGIDPPEQNGWDWAATKSLRWGLNTVEYINALPILGTTVFMTDFDDVDPILYESQAANGDSGGAVFTYDPLKSVELAGIMISVSLEYGQDSTSTIFTNETIIASLDVYADQIEQNIINTPEPTGGLMMGLGALVLMARSRRSRSC
jgi:hypothetical protein